MQETSISLLQRLQHEVLDEGAWVRFDQLYRPYLTAWMIRRGIPENDRHDLCQTVMLIVCRALPKFEHNGRPGAFRNWLGRITSHEFIRYGKVANRLKIVELR